MIGSPDLLPFTGAELFGDGSGERDAEALPEELSVPLFPRSHPWVTSARFHSDFILVAEFSEKVGPKPVLTIPDDPRVVGSFDLNHFSVRIMSVDYQASGPTPTDFSSPGFRLNFSEDSKVILGDSGEDAFAYVHHLTLYDLEARGMVRPFCMAYVCSDQAKLMEHFSELSTCFSLASDSLKTGNRRAFAMELQRKLQKLECTCTTLRLEAELLRTANGITDGGEKADELAAVQHSISDHRDLLRQVTSYPNRKLQQPDFLPYDPADSLTDLTGFLTPEHCPSTSSSSSCKSGDHLKSLEELSDSYFLSLTLEQLADTERRLRGNGSLLRAAHVSRSLSRMLTFTNFLFELWNPEDTEEEGESLEAELQRATEAKRGLGGFQGELPSLESFYSCVEEIPIKMEPGEGDAGTPDLNVAEMIGSVSSGDSIEVLGTEKSYRTQHVVAGSDPREAHVEMTDFCVRHAPADTGVRRVRAYARRANSEDSIEVLSTTESIFPDDLTAITEEEAEHQSLSNGSQDVKETMTEHICGGVDKVEEPRIREVEELKDTRVKEEEGPTEGAVNTMVMIREEMPHESLKTNQIYEDGDEDGDPEDTSTPPQVQETVEPMLQCSDVQQTVPSSSDLHVTLAPPTALAEVSRWPSPYAPLRLLSLDEASDCTSVSGLLSTCQSFLSNRRRRKAGLRALRFLKQHSFSQHALFCLLSGRPLVIIGGDASSVRKLVEALSLFLPAPGPHGNAVMPCLTTPLQLADLLTWRLMGIHRSPSTFLSGMLPSLTRYSRYLALLDLDQRTLRCPSYSGSIIGRMVHPHTSIGRGSTYLLHLESCLTALTNQALLYTFNPVLQRPSSDGGKDAEKGADSTLTQGVCSSESDLRVMGFLSDLIRQHHAGRGPPVLRISHSSVNLHRNTNAT
ncbi:guanine nucleotide exchange protein smcr8b [Genypterus blacodes]|uniref:guanine nucleotide exchange protein smcr8b n=1 Tax=Genypterus blacodes TaxID=154954 RepID=UPI003F76EBCA